MTADAGGPDRILRLVVLQPGAARVASKGTWVGLALVLAIQGFMLIGLTGSKDLETGDTSSYFGTSLGWAAELRGSPLWSPLYTLLMSGSFSITGDAQTTVIVMRVVALLVSTSLVFLILRRFLALPLAVLLVALWASNPAYYDSLYSVHLWALPLPLAALACVAYAPGARGNAVAVLLIALNAVFMRNEYLLVLALFLVILVVASGKGLLTDLRRAVGGHWRLYAVLLGIFAVLVAGLGLRSTLPIGSEQFAGASAAKHTLNVCQIYAYYRQQVGDARVTDPWSGCSGVMMADFGSEAPSMTEAFVSNPTAMGGMILHNARLLPNGVQILATGAFGGGYSPDYWPQRQSPWAPWLTMLMAVLAIVGLGTVVSARARASLPGTPVANVPFFGLLASTFAVGAFVALTQRPRPSYLYLMAVALLLLAGLGLTWLARRTTAGGLVLVAVLALWGATRLVSGSVYGTDYVNLFTGPGQPELGIYRTLKGQAPDPALPPAHITITSPVDPGGLCEYLSRWQDDCTPIVGEPVSMVVTVRK